MRCNPAACSSPTGSVISTRRPPSAARAKLQLSAVELDQIGDDAEAEPGPRSALVEPHAPFQRAGDFGVGEAGAVILDMQDQHLRPLPRHEPHPRGGGGAPRYRQDCRRSLPDRRDRR